MSSQKSANFIDKNRAVLEATEKIETVMSLERPIPADNPTINSPGVPPMPPGYTLLWCLVLITQFLIFCWQKRK